MSSMKTCGCKGIRSCLLCEKIHNAEIVPHYTEKIKVYNYCSKCKKAWTQTTETDCEGHHGDWIHFPGITVLEDFVSAEEEQSLCQEIDKTKWVQSQSGRRKQDYGPKVNFKKKKLNTTVFTGLPFFSKYLVHRMQDEDVLEDFHPIELCNLEYDPERGSAIEPHFDDFWIWGKRLVTLSLLTETKYTMTIDKHPDIEVCVLLPRRSLLVMQGPSRYEWKHSIQRKDITARRVAITFRELTPEFFAGGPNEQIGRELLETAACFQGLAVGCDTKTKS